MAIEIDGILEQGGVLKLTRDVNLKNFPLYLSDYTKLDLNGFTLTSADSQYAIKIFHNKVTICNGKIRGYRGISVDEVSDLYLNSVDVEVEGRSLGVYDGSHVNISRDSIIHTTTSDCTILVLGDKDLGKVKSVRESSLIVNGTVINDSETDISYAISGNGLELTGVNIAITNTAKITAKYTAVFLSFKGKTVIDGATISGATAIGIKGGTLDIKNATIESFGVKKDFTEATGFDPTGDAIAVASTNYPAGVPIVTLSNNSVISKNAKAISTYKYNTEEDSKCEIKSGRFKPTLDNSESLFAPYCVSLSSGDVCKIGIVSKKFYTKDEDALDKSGTNSNLYVILNYNFIYKNKVISGKVDEYVQIVSKLTVDEDSGLTVNGEVFPIQYKTFAEVFNLIKPSIMKNMASEIYKFDIKSYNSVFLSTVNKIK